MNALMCVSLTATCTYTFPMGLDISNKNGSWIVHACRTY